MNEYNVLVDFHTTMYDLDVLEADFADGQFIEQIGHNQYQVGYGCHAPNPSDAYRRGVNLVNAKLELLGCTSDGVIGAEVYGPDETEEVPRYA